MDATSSKKRKTEIVDDLAMAALCAPKPKKPKKTAKNGGLNHLPATSANKPAHQRADAPPKNGARAAKPKAASSAECYYVNEQEGVRISLYNATGKKKTARAFRTVMKKNKNDLLDIIEEYGGEAMRNSMEPLPNMDMAEWIVKWEAIAFGASVKGATSAATQAPDNGGPAQQKTGAVNATATKKSGGATHISPTNPKPHGQRANQNDRRPANGIATTNSRPPPQQAASPPPRNTTTMASPRNAQPPPPKKDTTRQNIQTPASPRLTEKTTASSPEATSETPSRLPVKQRRAPIAQLHGDTDDEDDESTHEEVEEKKVLPANMAAGERPSSVQKHPQPRVEEFITRSRQGPTHLLQEHPLNRILDLDHTEPTGSTKIVDFPERKEWVIVTTTSATTVHETTIPYANAPSPAPKKPQAPFLKPGKHGYDYELHKWSFEGDPDLETGVGHQIEPADKERLARDPGFEKEFRSKYRGYMANQWPCGCQMPWNDEDSEAE